jgi:hypothetical protein
MGKRRLMFLAAELEYSRPGFAAAASLLTMILEHSLLKMTTMFRQRRSQSTTVQLTLNSREYTYNGTDVLD